MSDKFAVALYAVLNSGFIRHAYSSKEAAEEYVAANLANSPEVEIKKMRFVAEELVNER